MAERGETPPSLAGRPETPADLVFVWSAFWRLHTERPLGFGGAGPIPHSAVTDYADRLGMGPDEAEWFGELIAAMDRVYLKWASEQREEGG